MARLRMCAALAPSAKSGHRQVLYEEDRAITGLELPPGEEGTIVVSKDLRSEGLLLEVFNRTVLSESSIVATRALTDQELEGLYHMNLHGMPRDRASVAHYAWLSDLVEIRGLEWGCDAYVHLKDYDDKLESISCLRADLHGMLDVQRDRVRSWQQTPDSDSSESRRSEILVASRRIGIRAEVAEALYDYFLNVDTSGNGLIEELEFRACMLNICRVGDRVNIDEDRIHRCWCELQAQAPNHQVGFVRFTEWLLAKFPHVADMTSWQVRRFAGIHHATSPARATSR